MTLATSPPESAKTSARLRTTRPDTDAAGLGRSGAVAFVAPGLLLIGVFLVFPAVWTLYIGVTNYRLTGVTAARPDIVGIDNYVDVLGDQRFQHSLWLTLVFVAGSALLGQSVLGFAIAWTMQRARRSVRSLVEGLVLLAWIIPGSVASFLWVALLDRSGGTVNALLGTPGAAWLLEHPMESIIVFNTWRGTAFSMLLFSSALASVPPSQLESARMAGAGTFAQLRDVVLPNIRGHLLTNTLLISMWTFNDFTPYLITAGGPNRESEILPVYIYQVAISGGSLGKGAAISLIMLLINLVIALVYLRVLRGRRS